MYRLGARVLTLHFLASECVTAEDGWGGGGGVYNCELMILCVHQIGR
jgi:hypothetical protein